MLSNVTHQEPLEDDTNAVVFIWVGSQEESERNAAIDIQNSAVDIYCRHKGYNIIARFQDVNCPVPTSVGPGFLAMMDFLRNPPKKVDFFVSAHQYRRQAATAIPGLFNAIYIMSEVPITSEILGEE